MIAVIGLQKTIVLLESWGGTHLELPQGRLWRKHRGALAELIGQDSADAFHREFAQGERRMLLPKVDKILIQLRDAQICVDADDGASVRDQALHYRLTERQIQKIRARGPRRLSERAEHQLDLFSASNDETHPNNPAGERLNAV